MLFFAGMVFMGCKEKNPVAGKKMILTDTIFGEEMEFTYVFSDSQYWLDGVEGIKGTYQYDKETDTISLDGGEPQPLSEFKQVK